MRNNDYHNQLLKSLPESYKHWFEIEKKYLEKHITKDASVLEVGSGDGRSVCDLIPITKNITGVDHDENAIKEAKNHFNEYQFNFVLTDAENLPFESESFDFVICMGSFMNFSTKKFKILEEMKRVLKKDGKIIISTFSENALTERMKVYSNLNVPIKEVTEKGTVIFDESLGDNVSEQFSKEELTDIFSKVDLKVENMEEVEIAYLVTLTK